MKRSSPFGLHSVTQFDALSSAVYGNYSDNIVVDPPLNRELLTGYVSLL